MSEKQGICSTVVLLLLSLCIAERPYLPAHADLVQVMPGGGWSFHLGGSGRMPWQELGAGAAGASLSSRPAVQTPAWPLAPTSSLSEKGLQGVGACACSPRASGAERPGVCGRVCGVRHRQRSPPCPRALNQAPS